MKVLIVEPGRRPWKTDILHTLEDMQKTVGGYIELIEPFDDPVVLVCNEEGKLKGLELNRAIAGKDIIAGTFFLCGAGAEDLTDLPDDMAEKYETLFRYPETFLPVAGGIMMISEDGRQEIIR